jgi:hypothetical protein
MRNPPFDRDKGYRHPDIISIGSKDECQGVFLDFSGVMIGAICRKDNLSSQNNLVVFS